jgi:hypothetical protein
MGFFTQNKQASETRVGLPSSHENKNIPIGSSLVRLAGRLRAKPDPARPRNDEHAGSVDEHCEADGIDARRVEPVADRDNRRDWKSRHRVERELGADELTAYWAIRAFVIWDELHG